MRLKIMHLTSPGPHWLGRLTLLGWPVRDSKGSTRKHAFHMRTKQPGAHIWSHLLCLALTVQEKRVLALITQDSIPDKQIPLLQPRANHDHPNQTILSCFPCPVWCFPQKHNKGPPHVLPSLLLLPSSSGASPCGLKFMPLISSGTMSNNNLAFQWHGPVCIVTQSPLEIKTWPQVRTSVPQMVHLGQQHSNFLNSLCYFNILIVNMLILT